LKSKHPSVILLLEIKKKEKDMKNYLKGSLLSLLMLLILFPVLSAQTNEFSLEQCIDYAWENSTDVSRTNNSIDSKQSILEQSKAALLPNLSLGLSHDLSTSKNYLASDDSWNSENHSSTSLSLSSSVTLFNGAKLINTIRQNKSELSATEYEVQTRRELLSLEILTAYINVLLANEQYLNRETQLNSTEQQLALAEARKSAGVLSNSDYMNIKSEYASDKAALISAKGAKRISLVALMQTMNMPVDESLTIVEPDLESIIDEEKETDAEKIYEIALEIRPELKTADLNLKSAEIGIKIAKADALPTVSLRGALATNYSDALSGVDFGEQFSNKITPSIGLAVSVPIFQNKKVKNQVTQATIQVKESQLTLIDTKNNLRKSIEQSCTDSELAKVSYEASLEQFLAAQESYHLAVEMFSQGLINSVDYQSSKNTFINAKNSLTQTKYNVLLQNKIINYFCGLSILF